MIKDTISKIQLAALLLISIPCFADLGIPDVSCNPAVNTPVSGGCTWYNFSAMAADGSIHAGSSFTNYYIAAPAPPWTITTITPAVIRIVDGGHQGDMFTVYDNGVLLGETSSTFVDDNHSCAGDTTGPGTDPAACWNDPLMSKGTFTLSPGAHSITLVWNQRVPGGDSTLQWFEIGAAPVTPTLSFMGSMPDVVTEENWTSTFTLFNKGGAAAQTNLSITGDNGVALPIPLSLSTGASVTASLNSTVPANGSLVAVSSGPAPSVVQGGAQLTASGPVDGFAIFHTISNNQEAVVPLETRNSNLYILPFDNTSGVVLGVALQNVSASAANITVILRNDTGLQIGSGSVNLPASGHTSFVLSTQFPVTANIRGTAEFHTPTGGQISLLGIRYTGGTLTTIPVLANVTTTNGSIAHIASGNGWTTTFVLVNTGSSFAQANLSFFADNGTPLSLPYSFPQQGTAITTASSATPSIPPGGMVLVKSTGVVSDPLLIGSAQIAVNGPISGFVIFRYEPNGQEAVVPLENRNAAAYVLAFDNTAGTATGVSVNNASNVGATIPVIIRNNSGAQIGTGSIVLAANGHSSFVLKDQFPVTASIQGTIEFDTPAGASIGALGIRTPVAHTFTTLPALAK